MTREELNEKMALMQQKLAAVSAMINQPVDEDEATTEDYLAALEELGVDTSEES